MYHALLTNRYLTTRVIPFIAVAAVALCTALVIIVVSVMSGFVDMIRNAGRTLMGDVIISYPLRGIPHYERLIKAIEDQPEAAAASPVVDSWGLLKMPYGDTEVVQVWGIEPLSFAKVTSYESALYWRPTTDDEWTQALVNITTDIWEHERLDSYFPAEAIEEARRASSDPLRRVLHAMAAPANRKTVLDLPLDEMRTRLPELLDEGWWRDLWRREPRLRPESATSIDLDYTLEAGRTLRFPDGSTDAIVPGIHVSKANERRHDGSYRVLGEGSWWMPLHQVTLTVLPVTSGGAVTDPQSHVFQVANEAQFGVFQIDDKRVLAPLPILQKMLEFDAATVYDPEQLDPQTGLPLVVGTTPAKVTMILVSGEPGVTPTALKAVVEREYARLGDQLRAERDPTGMPRQEFGVMIRTWEEQNAQIIGPVEKERNLMRILFSIVYLVCAGLVLVIFWAIVYEKTKDIGILRSIGASRVGILWVFVRYGLVVGAIGSVIGLGIAFAVIHNINHIHNALGERFPAWTWLIVFGLSGASLVTTLLLITRQRILPVIAGALTTIVLVALGGGMMLHQGFLVWDPQVYYFTEIPNRLDLTSGITTMIGATVFSVIGALIPAARAADFDPVAALRYE